MGTISYSDRRGGLEVVELTGERRYRYFWGKLVLQVEVGCRAAGYSSYDYTYWRDARTEDLCSISHSGTQHRG